MSTGGDKLPEFIGCIEIMDNVFVGTHSILLPNVKIGPNVIIGAGSLITKDCEPDSVYAGVPAKRVGSFTDFVRRKREGNYAYTRKQKWSALGRCLKDVEVFNRSGLA